MGSGLIRVYHCPEMNVPDAAEPASWHRSAVQHDRVARLVERWTRLMGCVELVEPLPPVGVAAVLRLAHDRRFVDDVLTLRRDNGLGTRCHATADAARWQVGALVGAARWAMRERGVACVPIGAFGQAGWDRAAGPGTFNTGVVAARMLMQLRLAERVGVLDCSGQPPDGTDEIIDRLRMHDRLLHVCAADDFLESTDDPERLRRWLVPKLRWMNASGASVIFYVAGADQHVDEPGGGGLLSREQMLWRDRTVFHWAHMYGVPLVWTLGAGRQRCSGGTLEPALALHTQTLQQHWAICSLDEELYRPSDLSLA